MVDRYGESWKKSHGILKLIVDSKAREDDDDDNDDYNDDDVDNDGGDDGDRYL
jgi:hypothetical protein